MAPELEIDSKVLYKVVVLDERPRVLDEKEPGLELGEAMATVEDIAPLKHLEIALKPTEPRAEQKEPASVVKPPCRAIRHVEPPSYPKQIPQTQREIHQSISGIHASANLR